METGKFLPFSDRFFFTEVVLDSNIPPMWHKLPSSFEIRKDWVAISLKSAQ